MANKLTKRYGTFYYKHWITPAIISRIEQRDLEKCVGIKHKLYSLLFRTDQLQHLRLVQKSHAVV